LKDKPILFLTADEMHAAEDRPLHAFCKIPLFEHPF
jgi:hypothetical protein